MPGWFPGAIHGHSSLLGSKRSRGVYTLMLGVVAQQSWAVRANPATVPGVGSWNGVFPYDMRMCLKDVSTNFRT